MLKLFENKKFLFILALINFIAGIYALQYYFLQLQNTNPLLWIFVVDCPLYAFLFGIILILKIKKIEKPWLVFIVLVGVVKYALWTLFVLWQGNFLAIYYTFTWSHILMVVETLVFFRVYAFKIRHVLLAIVWFIVCDFFDYVIGTHPFFEGNFENVMIFAILSTIFLPILLSLIYSRQSI